MQNFAHMVNMKKNDKREHEKYFNCIENPISA
jgi:hypothetical protein